MADVSSDILLRFDADTAKVLRKLAKVEQANDDIAQSADRTGKATESSLESITKWAVGLTAAYSSARKAIDFAVDGFKLMSEQSRLVAASSGANYKRVQDAASGLITKMDAMRISAELMNGSFGATQDDLEVVAEFMVNLRNEGHDMAEVMREVKRALVEANAEGLKKFGIQIKAASGSLEAHNAILDEFRRKNAEAGGDVLRFGDEMTIAHNKLTDSFDQFRMAAGRLAVALTPVVDRLAQIVAKMAEFVEAGSAIQLSGLASADATIRERLDTLRPELKSVVVEEIESRRAAGEFGGLEQFVSDVRYKTGGFKFFSSEEADVMSIFVASIKRHTMELNRQIAILEGKEDPLIAELGIAGKGVGKGRANGGDNDRDKGRGMPKGGIVIENMQVTAGAGVMGGIIGGAEGGAGALPDLGGGLGGAVLAAMIDEEEAQRRKEAFDQLVAGVQSGLGKIGLSLESLQTSAVSSWDAVITGSMSAGEAMKSFFAETIRGISNHLFAKALEESALAIASLAIYDFRGAAQHGEAAALAGAGAALTGVIASQMGAGGGGRRSIPSGGGGVPGSSSLPGSATGSIAGGGTGRGTDTERVIIVGSPFDDDPRRTRRRIHESLENVRRDVFSSERVVEFA